MIDPDFVEAQNAPLLAALLADYDRLGEDLMHRGIDIARVTAGISAATVLVSTGGAWAGVTSILDRLDDCALIHALTRGAAEVALHVVVTDDATPLHERATAVGLSFGAVAVEGGAAEAMDMARRLGTSVLTMTLDSAGPEAVGQLCSLLPTDWRLLIVAGMTTLDHTVAAALAQGPQVQCLILSDPQMDITPVGTERPGGLCLDGGAGRNPVALVRRVADLMYSSDAAKAAPLYLLTPGNAPDPVQAGIVTLQSLRQAQARALLLDGAEWVARRGAGDATGTAALLHAACDTDVEPILAMVRLEEGGAIDPLAAFRDWSQGSRRP